MLGRKIGWPIEGTFSPREWVCGEHGPDLFRGTGPAILDELTNQRGDRDPHRCCLFSEKVVLVYRQLNCQTLVGHRGTYVCTYIWYLSRPEGVPST